MLIEGKSGFVLQGGQMPNDNSALTLQQPSASTEAMASMQSDHRSPAASLSLADTKVAR